MKQEAFDDYNGGSKPDDYNEGSTPDDYNAGSTPDDVIKKDDIKEVTTNDGAYLPFCIEALLTIIFTHIGGAYGLYLCFTSTMWKTILFALVVQRINLLGISGGAHRLWCHRAYKATLPVRIFLMIAYTSAHQLSIRHWVRDHRVHHKYTETDADPHNSNRGMYFSHMGWIIRKRHPENLKKLYSVDLSDLMADPVIRFNEKYYYFLSSLFAVFFPTAIPMYFWNETFASSFFVVVTLRYIVVLHETFCVNSVAHAWGYRPYDSSIKPVEAPLLQLLSTGEGFHNYHHVFPFDYGLSEFGLKFNITKAFIDLLSLFGLTYDFKTAPKSVIKARKNRNKFQTLAENSDLNRIPEKSAVRGVA